MQNDLISRSEILKALETWGGDVDTLEQYIKDMPTSYDVEKVVAELEEEKNSTYERCVKGMFDALVKDMVKKISNGGKE